MAEPIELIDDSTTLVAAGSPDETNNHRRVSRLDQARGINRDLLALAGLLVVLAFVWGRGRGVWYWIDEGISIGISGHPFTQVPKVLRLDGSPPLYYLILHVWMAVFGTSEAATHTLSLLFALAVVPAALWAGWSLFGRRAGWFAAILAGLSPFLAGYGNETRMYTLLALLSVLATATFTHAFVYGRRRYLAPFSLSQAAMMYTHNWALFYAIAAGMSLVACLVVLPKQRRRLLVDGALAFGAAGLLYLPWVPSLMYQLAHTGTPFLLKPTLLRVRANVIYLVGGPYAAVALALGAAPALVAMARTPRRRVAIATAIVATMGAATLFIALMVSRRQSVWEVRYLAVFIGPLLMVLSVALSRGGQAAISALAVAAFFSAPIAVKAEPYRKSNVREVALGVGSSLRPGDLVISDFGRTPVLAHYLPEGLSYAESTGPVDDPFVSDQREGAARLRNTDPAISLAQPLSGLSSGAKVLVVCPQIRDKLNDDAPEFLVLIPKRCDQSLDLLRGDNRFRLDVSVTDASNGFNPVNAFLFTKVG